MNKILEFQKWRASEKLKEEYQRKVELIKEIKDYEERSKEIFLKERNKRVDKNYLAGYGLLSEMTLAQVFCIQIFIFSFLWL